MALKIEIEIFYFIDPRILFILFPVWGQENEKLTWQIKQIREILSFPPHQNVKFMTSPKFNILILVFSPSKIENLPYAKMQSQILNIP
jgi:hypothetical protein